MHDTRAAALALTVALALPAAAQPARAPLVIDRIVAVVNNEVITRGDLEERFRVATAQLKKQGTPPPPRDVLEKQLLDRLIIDRVQLQFARETGLRVDDTELDRALQRIAQDNTLSLPELRAALE